MYINLFIKSFISFFLYFWFWQLWSSIQTPMDVFNELYCCAITHEWEWRFLFLPWTHTLECVFFWSCAWDIWPIGKWERSLLHAERRLSREESAVCGINVAVVPGLSPAVISRPVNTFPPAASRWFGLKDVCCMETVLWGTFSRASCWESFVKTPQREPKD